MFSNVEVAPLPPAPRGRANNALQHARNDLAITSDSRHVLYVAPEKFEAPNWTRDGKALIFNRNGRIVHMAGRRRPDPDHRHGLRDSLQQRPRTVARRRVAGDQRPVARKTTNRWFTSFPLPAARPARITQKSPSYWHGWSPDGQTLAFVGERNGEFDIYTILAAGGEETAPDHRARPRRRPGIFARRQIYLFQFRAHRHDANLAHASRRYRAGTSASDDSNNWFPHISPDGKWMVFLYFEKDVKGHPPNQNVMLRLMSLSDKKDQDSCASCSAGRERSTFRLGRPTARRSRSSATN